MRLLLALLLASAAMGQETAVITVCPPGTVPGDMGCTTTSIVRLKRTFILNLNTITLEEGTKTEYTISVNQPINALKYPKGFDISIAYPIGCSGPTLVTIPVGSSSVVSKYNLCRIYTFNCNGLYNSSIGRTS